MNDLELGEATIESQFYVFSKVTNRKAHEERTGETINLFRSDYWLRQAGILNDRTVHMTDTGMCFFKFSKSELTFDEWSEMLSDLCAMVDLNEERTILLLTNCGLPGEITVNVPKFRDYFKTYKDPKQLIDSKIDM